MSAVTNEVLSANREYPGRKCTLRVELLEDGRHRLIVQPHAGQAVHHRKWVSSYPLEMILQFFAAKDLSVCDEIMREEDPKYVEHKLRSEVLAYLPPSAFAGKRILDFGCGSGASPLVLGRLLPPCEIVGIELEPKLLELARLRARYFGRPSLKLLQSPSPDSLPPELGEFDFIMFNAVFEHLLPNERRALLPLVWRHLKPGGVLFLNQTPYRWSPVEIHTTQGMPLINYLPDSMTLWAARRYCKRVARDESWESLLRRGIRGGTVPEIIGILGGPERAQPLRPLPEIGDRVDLWFKTLSQRHALFKRSLWLSLKMAKWLSGREITPTLSLAIRKSG
ncbi:MAG TPA: methyltransferase domain-containing protein [Steroidobacteraceae bacterium]|jgi:SAM-dependent methyltransferase